MQLKMMLGNKIVDSIPVIFSKISKPGYLEDLRNDLTERHQEMIIASYEKPQFFIDNVPSKMNSLNKKKD